jgi:hypothetical protein
LLRLETLPVPVNALECLDLFGDVVIDEVPCAANDCLLLVGQFELGFDVEPSEMVLTEIEELLGERVIGDLHRLINVLESTST